MPQNEPRITGPTLKVLKELIAHPADGLSGAEIAKATGLASGTLYPILFRLEKSGWLQSEWEVAEASELRRPRKRLYRMTAVGDTSGRATFRELLPDTRELAWR